MTEFDKDHITLYGTQPSSDTHVSSDGFSISNEELDKAHRLQQAKTDKLNRLSKIDQKASLANSYTALDNGRVEGNKNKIWNDLNGQDYQSVLDHGLSNYTLTKNAQGDLVYPSGELYSGPTRRLYMFGTQDSTNGQVKFGLASGHTNGAEERYIPGTSYGWAPGEMGVDIADKQMDILLPDNVATMLEGLAHGRQEALEGRTVKDRYGDPELAGLYGSGASEYYDSREALLGPKSELNPERGARLFKQHLADIQAQRPDKGIVDEELELARIKRINQEYAAENAGLLDQASNTLSGFGATFVNELLVNPLDAVGDLTGTFDLGTEEEKDARTNEFFGYNPVAAEQAMERVSAQWDVVADDTKSTAERMKAAGNGILEAFLTPEMLGTSLGALASWLTPGVVLKGVGVGSKYALAAQKIDKLVEAGKLSSMAGRAQKAKRLMSVEGLPAALASQSGFIVSALGNINNQYEEFVQNNNGQELEGIDKAKWFAGRFAVQMVNQNLDKLVDVSILKNPGMVASAVPAVKAMTNKEFAKVAATMGTGVAVTAQNMGKEAAQEYSQTMMELFNSRYGSEQFDDVNNFVDFVSDERNTTEAGIAALAGAGGSGQFEVAGSAVKTLDGSMYALGAGASKAAEKLQEYNNKETPLTEAEQEEAIEIASSPEAPPIDSDHNIAAKFIQKQEEGLYKQKFINTYYLDSTSKDPEARKKAAESAKVIKDELLKPESKLFYSDAELSEEKTAELAEKIAIVVADDPNISTEELIEAIVTRFKPEEQTKVQKAVVEGHTTGMQFASIKSMAEAAEEASVGARGFITYYNAAKAAKAEGDQDTYQRNLGQLETFYTYEKEKLGFWKDGITEVRKELISLANLNVQTGKATNEAEALLELMKTHGDKERIVQNADRPDAKTTKVKYSDVINRMVNPKYDRGIYKLYFQVADEVSSMEKVYNDLSKEIKSEEYTPSSDVNAQTAPVDTSVDIDTQTESPSEEVAVSGIVQDTAMEEDVEDSIAADLADLDNLNDFSSTVDPLESLEDVDGMELPGFDPATDVSTEVDADTFIEPDLEITPTEPETEVEVSKQLPEVQRFSELSKGIKDVSKRIADRTAELRVQGITGKDKLEDPTLVDMLLEKKTLEVHKDQHTSKFADTVNKRIALYKDHADKTAFTLYKSYNPNAPEDAGQVKIKDLFSNITPTGYTVAKRSLQEVSRSTQEFSDNLYLNTASGKNPAGNLGVIKNLNNNVASFVLYDEEGEMNANTVEAMHGAVNEFITQEASTLVSEYRNDEKIAELLDIEESQVTPAIRQMLIKGGMTLKLASSHVGEKVINNLGIQVDSMAEREALATALGTVALQGAEGSLVQHEDYVTSNDPDKTPIKARRLTFVKGVPTLFDELENVKASSKELEDTLGVEIDKTRSYERHAPARPRKVHLHRSEHQEAPKDHQDVVNRLERTPFKFNSGHNVLLELFNKKGQLDVESLVTHIVGDPKKVTNKDGKDSYDAKRNAVLRSVEAYTAAKEDIKEGNLFFKWFIAKNHRIHLDSNTLNPQNDKHVARWLLTAGNSRKTIAIEEIQKALNNDTDASMDAKMFAYAVVQAFDGAKYDNGTLDAEGNTELADVPSIDKNSEDEILEAARIIMDNLTTSDLMRMAKEADHVGHAALAIANIDKYTSGENTFDSDMVLEVDGLTNGFAFRAMQYPLESPNSPISTTEWLEKIGMITEGSDLYALGSMNAARNMGQEDVYITVGGIFNTNVAGQKRRLSKNDKDWINIFENVGALQDFTDTESDAVKGFVRKLMKSPVMIFGYAAGFRSIAEGLVNDQVMGLNYLKGKGLIDFLTKKDESGNYVITKKQLAVFADKAEIYHQARQDLEAESINSVTNPNIVVLREDLNNAITNLYKIPLEETLKNLFSSQTEVNTNLVNAAAFMFDYFKEQYDDWKMLNPKASEEDKLEYLRDMAEIIPGVGGASSDDKINKVTFLKTALEPTGNHVWSKVGNDLLSSNTVSRTFGAPGVGPAVLTILSLDSSVLAKTINETYRSKARSGLLPVHDAIILGVGESEAINSYNTNFYTTNRRYSVLEEFVKTIDQLEDTYPQFANRYIIDNEGEKVTYSMMKSSLNTINRKVQAKRKEIFDSNSQMGQLVGPVGTMSTFNIADRKAESNKYLAEAADTILDQMGQDTIKEALGDNYEQELKTLKKMLEGCK